MAAGTALKSIPSTNRIVFCATTYRADESIRKSKPKQFRSASILGAVKCTKFLECDLNRFCHDNVPLFSWGYCLIFSVQYAGHLQDLVFQSTTVFCTTLVCVGISVQQNLSIPVLTAVSSVRNTTAGSCVPVINLPTVQSLRNRLMFAPAVSSRKPASATMPITPPTGRMQPTRRNCEMPESASALHRNG